MAFSNIIRGVGKTASSVGRAVRDMASRITDEDRGGAMPMVPGESQGIAMSGAPNMAGDVPNTPAPAAPARAPFTLPDLGPAPDAAAAEFQGDEGKRRYADALRTYQHKQDIHQAYQDIDRIYTEAHPDRDFAKEYDDYVAMQKQHEAERPQGSGLARAALALGDFNPAVQKSGRSNLDTYNQGIREDQSRSDASFTQRLALRQRMHEQAAQEAQAQGNWKKALAERERADLLKVDADAIEHQRKVELESTKQAGAADRARIRRDAVENSARIRANAIGSSHGLTGGFLKQFEKEAAKAVARLLGPRDLTKDYAPADVDTITDYLEAIAEMLHDQQQGTEDGGDEFHRTPPGKRKPPKQKEQF